MEEGKVKELEAKLREMFEDNDMSRSKERQMQAKPANFVIRRRKGEADKRIPLSNSAR
jgi:hypothetical protein